MLRKRVNWGGVITSAVANVEGEWSVVDGGLENRLEWNDDVIMTSSEVAKFLKVHLGSVRRWTRTGELKGYRLGERGDWRYLRRDVLDFLFKYSQTAMK